MPKYFGNITVQSKDDVEDFRSFAHVRDSKGKHWELRGYGKTAGEAAQDAWNRYVEKEKFWPSEGYELPELWTKKKPTEPGAYWVCCKSQVDKPWAGIVTVYRNTDKKLCVNGYTLAEYYWLKPGDLWWYGPLEVPETPFKKGLT